MNDLSRAFGREEADAAECERRIGLVFEAAARRHDPALPEQRSFAATIERAGLVDVGCRNLSFGMACIHAGTRRPVAAARR